MSLVLNRNRLFALVGALEDDLRSLIETYLLASRSDEDILGPAFDRAADRFEADGDRDLAESQVVDYLDLGDEIEILNRWRDELPPETSEALSRVAGMLSQLIPIRNRVMHRRPLLPDDPDRAEQTLLQLEAGGFEGVAVRDVIRQLRLDAAWSPQGVTADESSGALNNLPLVDFDETGLIGRRRELEQLARQLGALSTSRSPVLTVVGPGGVGKTALVLQALHDLVNDTGCTYDLVSWVSLKTERLTAHGVEAIQDAVLSVEQAVPAMVDALDEGFEGGIAHLAQAFEGLTVLLVIDNLETVSGREVLELIDALPQSVSYLFTSREGLGEVERRFLLGPLQERYAVDLFRRLCRARGLDHLARLDALAATELIKEQLGTSPLALKWFVAGVEAGQDPVQLARRREDLVRYCVENVFKALGAEAQQVARVLHILARPATVPEVHLFLPDLNPDHLRSAMQSLDRRMLVRRDTIPGSVTETFEATEALSDYLRLALDEDEETRVRKVEDDYRRADERHRLDAANDPLRPNIIQGGEDHRASVFLLRDAMLCSKRGDFDGALRLVLDAEALDAEFWEIHRVRGFVLSTQGLVDEATASYLRAVELAPGAKQAAAVKYFFAGHLTRRARDARRAVGLAREAHAELDSERTAIELGKALTYVGEFEEARGLLETGTAAADTRTRLIATTLLVECLRRRAEEEAATDRQPAHALATLTTAAELAETALRHGLVDRRLLDAAVECVAESLQVAAACPEEHLDIDLVDRCLLVLGGLGRDVENCESFGLAVGYARRLVREKPPLRDSLPNLANLAQARSLAVTTDSAGEAGDASELGTIKAWLPDRRFGFIWTVDRDVDVYFNISSLLDPADEIALAQGRTVRFVRSTAADGRPQAINLVVQGASTDMLLDRQLLVHNLHSSGLYLFATDTESGATVFVGRHAMKDGTAWRTIEVGLELDADVEIDDDRRFSAAARSVRIADQR